MAKSAKPVRWSDVVRVRARYQRSVHLERDSGEPEWLKGYIVTPLGRTLVSRLAAGLQAGGTARAWSLTGPYGSGKSAFTLFLSHLLGTNLDRQSQAARDLLRRNDPELVDRLAGREGAFGRDDGLIPVLATGERRPLQEVLLCALRDSVQRHWGGRGTKPDVIGRVLKAAKRADSGEVLTTKEVVALFEEVADKVKSSAIAGNGLLIILDEAGKVLEHASQATGRTGDVILLQELAEAATRSADTPIVLVLTLHQSFERYASRLGVAQRSEWGKVQGRFEDVAFQEASDQVLRLIAAALDRSVLPDDALAVAKKATARVAGLARLPGVMKSHEFAQLLLGAVPLHPVTALLLGPLFRSRIGQNERSLFAFLATAEPGGFQDFLCAAPGTHPAWSLYTVDLLYDYVKATFGTRLYEYQGRQWAQIETALGRLPDGAEDLDARLIKTIGIIGLLGEPVGLAASEEILSACTGATRTAEVDAVRRSLGRLQSASIAMFRKYRNAYQLWEGSDIDVDAHIGKALKELDQYTSATRRAAQAGADVTLIARRHLFETGTLRHFEVRFGDEAILENGLVEPSGEQDGVVWLIIPNNAQAHVDLRHKLVLPLTWVGISATSRPSIVALPLDAEKIRLLALEVAALEWVQLHTPELHTDVTARREVSARLSEADRILRQELQRLLAGVGACEWFYRGRTIPVSSARDLARLLSSICDDVYSAAPAIHNELLNRRQLSSAAAAARRALMVAMSQHGRAKNLGIEGFPPEMSMYRSLLERHGLHRQNDEHWGFAGPTNQGHSLRPAYDSIRGRLKESGQSRVSLATIYDGLRRPPFGIADGVLPVLLLSVMLEFESEIAVYEDGVFVPALTAPVIERMLKSPDKLEVQLFEIVGAREELLQKLQALIAKPSSQKNHALLGIVRELVRMARTLPDYSRNTRSIAPRAQAVREALLRAREPGPLLFRDLPAAVGLDPLEATSTSNPTEMVERLRTSLRELGGSYARLLDQIDDALISVFGLARTTNAARKELEMRSHQLLSVAVDPTLKSFLVRALSTSLGRDEWLVALGTLLGGKPPESWHDRDAEQMQLTLGVVAGKFKRLESILLEQSRAVSIEGATALRLSVTQPGESERDQVVIIRDADRDLLESFCARVRDTLASGGADLPRETLLAGLAVVARELMVEFSEPRADAEKRVSK